MSEAEELFERALQNLRGPRATEEAQPAPAVLPAKPDYEVTSPAAAIAQCRDAWKRAYDAYIQKNARKDGGLVEANAKEEAAAAFRTAMPELATWCGIRDFIACVAYGILIDAIPSERTGQLLYAAQTAVSLLPRIPPF
jgi:hypothetical protein